MVRSRFSTRLHRERRYTASHQWLWEREPGLGLVEQDPQVDFRKTCKSLIEHGVVVKHVSKLGNWTSTEELQAIR